MSFPTAHSSTALRLHTNKLDYTSAAFIWHGHCMPRLPWSIVRHATRQDRLLGPLLTQCRDLDSAQNELRWLREHAGKADSRPRSINSSLSSDYRKHDDVKLSRLEAFVRRRAAGEPLQYIIGDQPFGDLDILCQRNVLIPRPETETYTTNLVHALSASGAVGKQHEPLAARQSLRILDICTGTGAIALLLHQILRQRFYTTTCDPTPEQNKYASPLDVQIVGLDVSTDAVRLARRNLEHNLQRQLLHTSAKDEVVFREIDVTKLALTENVGKQELTKLAEPAQWSHGRQWDIIISNPPYIAPDDYDLGGRTEKSVRNYEPRLALVPPQQPDGDLHPGDTFYPHILRIARQAGTSLIVMEVGDSAQAERVRQLVGAARLSKRGPPHVETWHDDGTVIAEPLDPTTQEVDPNTSEVQPDADTPSSARAVVVWRDKWAARRKSTLDPHIPIRRVLAETPWRPRRDATSSSVDLSAG